MQNLQALNPRNPQRHETIMNAEQARRRNASFDATTAGYQSVFGQGAAEMGLLIEFEYQRLKLSDNHPERPGEYDTRLVVRKQPKGDRLTVSQRIITEEEAERLYPEAYAAFKETGELPSSGTPLTELPGLSRSQIALLNLHGLRSIEDLVHSDEGMISRTGRELVRARKVAIAWWDNKENHGELVASAGKEAALEAELAALKAQQESMAEANKALLAQVEALSKISGSAAPAAAPAAAQAAATAGGVVEVADTFGFETYVENMPNPFDEGDPVDASEPLMDGEDDILDGID